MSANTEAGRGRGEAVKWVVVIALLLVAIVGNYLYRDDTAHARWLLWC